MRPSELTTRPQWKPTKAKDRKAPLGGPLVDGVRKAQALSNLNLNQYPVVGFCFDANLDPFVCIDLDDTTTIPPELEALPPTYTELSSSGNGLHLVFKTDKRSLTHLGQQQHWQDQQQQKHQLFISNQFVIITGNQVPNTPDTIATVDPVLLCSALSLPTTESAPVVKTAAEPHEPATEMKYVQAIPMEKLAEYLWSLPPTLSSSALRHKLERVYAQFNPPIAPSDYEHWRICAAAVHYNAALCGAVAQGAILFDQWSASDLENYPGPKATQQKYFDNAPKTGTTSASITHLTLQRLVAALNPIWPVVYASGPSEGHPIPTNIENFACMIDHYNLKLEENEFSGKFRITGNPLFNNSEIGADQLKLTAARIGQRDFFKRATLAQLEAHAPYWAGQAAPYNPVKEWILNAPEWNPKTDPSYFDKLWDTLTISKHKQENRNMYYIYLKKALMGIIRAHFYTGQFSESTGIVILIGQQDARKSSWLRQLLPDHLQEYVINSLVSLDRAANLKEIQIELKASQVWICDEAERILRASDAINKALMVAKIDSYRPVYGKEVVSRPRRTILFGTTNKEEIPITTHGSRRYMIIPVEQCDTDAIRQIPLAQVYRELLYEFECTPLKAQPYLWALTKEEQDITERLNAGHRSSSAITDILLETYDFSIPFKLEDFYGNRNVIAHTKLTTKKDVIHSLELAVKDSAKINAALHQLCAEWMGTNNVIIDKYWSIHQGWARSPISGYAKRTGWMLPPLRRFTEQLEEEHLD